MHYLERITAENLRPIWNLVKEGLDEIKKHSNDDWIAEDVYAAIRTGTSVLYVGKIDDMYCGFIVMTPFNTYATKILHIWCAYGINGAEVVKTFDAQLVEIAKSFNATKLTFQSPRRGWEVKGKTYGYNPVNTVFEKEVI